MIGQPLPTWSKSQQFSTFEPLPDVKFGVAAASPIGGGNAQTTYLTIVYGLIMKHLRMTDGVRAAGERVVGAISFVVDGHGACLPAQRHATERAQRARRGGAASGERGGPIPDAADGSAGRAEIHLWRKERGLRRARRIVIRSAMAKPKFKPSKQVAALAIRRDAIDGLRVMLVTSRGTKRYVAPKGWRMKGRQDHDAAQIEAMQEAGVVGRVRKKPIGFYEYWKRLSDHFEFAGSKCSCSRSSASSPTGRNGANDRSTGLLPTRRPIWSTSRAMSAIIRDLPKRLKTAR